MAIFIALTNTNTWIPNKSAITDFFSIYLFTLILQACLFHICLLLQASLFSLHLHPQLLCFSMLIVSLFRDNRLNTFRPIF